MNPFSRKTATAGALIALTAASLLASAPAASASGSGTACPTNRFCFYFNSDFGGARADFANSDAGLGNELFTDGPTGRSGWGVQVNNNAASVINHTGEYVQVHDATDCQGWFYYVAPGQALNLSDLGLKNQVSSIYIPGSDCISRDQTWA